MNVGLALVIDESLDSMSDVVTGLGDRLKKYFRKKDYGSDVCNLFIGVILTGRSVNAFKYRNDFRKSNPAEGRDRRSHAPVRRFDDSRGR